MYICLYYEIKTWGIINYAFQHNTIFNFFSPLLVRTIDWFGQVQSQIYVIRINSLIYLLLIYFLVLYVFLPYVVRNPTNYDRSQKVLSVKC